MHYLSTPNPNPDLQKLTSVSFNKNYTYVRKSSTYVEMAWMWTKQFVAKDNSQHFEGNQHTDFKYFYTSKNRRCGG